MHLRLATANDLPALMALVRRVVPQMQAVGNRQWDDSYPNEQVFSEDSALHQLWVAEAPNGTLAGFAAITTDQSPEYAEVGWDLTEPAIVIHRLAVDPGFQGQGVATLLMQQAETVARDRGISVLRVDTNTQNPVTQYLLPKLGYTLAGEIGLSYRPGLRFLCYEKRLAHNAAIALGSNLTSPFGEPADNLREAIRRLAALGRVSAVSSFHETAPVGYTGQPDFTNAALLLETDLDPKALMQSLLNLEREMGRDRSAATSPKGPRIIDLDLLLYDSLTLNTPHLTLPHPEMHTRRFVLEPLAEIAPQMRHPLSHLRIDEMLASFEHTGA